MQEYIIHLSNRNARVLEQLVVSGRFKNIGAAIGNATANYLKGLKQDSQSGNIIDPQPAINGARKTQEQWIAPYNAQEGEFKGKRMLDSYDVINAPRNQPNAVPSLIKDCIDYLLVTGTHIAFKPQENLAGDVIHNYQSTVVRPRVIPLDEIPVLEGIPVQKVVEMTSGLLYVRALANDMKAKPKDLLNNFEALAREAKKGIEQVIFWTPDQASRESNPERAVRFLDDGGGFHVDGDYRFVSNVGYSRGVSVSPRSGRAKK